MATGQWVSSASFPAQRLVESSIREEWYTESPLRATFLSLSSSSHTSLSLSLIPLVALSIVIRASSPLHEGSLAPRREIKKKVTFEIALLQLFSFVKHQRTSAIWLWKRCFHSCPVRWRDGLKERLPATSVDWERDKNCKQAPVHRHKFRRIAGYTFLPKISHCSTETTGSGKQPTNPINIPTKAGKKKSARKLTLKWGCRMSGLVA